jgi:hypothetical protein
METEAVEDMPMGGLDLGYWASLLTFSVLEVEYTGMRLVANRVDHNGEVLHAWTEILSRFT